MNEDNKSNQKILENFIVDNPDLETLEEIASQFNIFEALGIEQQELRHSDFLAWLLNPRETHGLGDYFLKKFLLRSATLAENEQQSGLSPIDVDTTDFSQTTVQREQGHIDILIVNKPNSFVCAIENKINSSEHGNQLKDYRTYIENGYPRYRMQLIYLTPYAIRASEENYINMGYNDISIIIEYILQVKGNSIREEVKILLQHYNETLRRHILENSEVKRLCIKIYEEHSSALDLIFENKPDLQLETSKYLQELIAENKEQLILDNYAKSYIRFCTKEWDIPSLKNKPTEGWSSDGRVLLFDFWNPSNKLQLNLTIGPGDNPIRKSLNSIAQDNLSFFQAAKYKTKDDWKWRTIWNTTFLSKNDYKESYFEAIKPKIKKQWESFLSDKLPKIKEALKDVPLQKS